MIENGVTQAEIERARNLAIAEYVYEADSLTGLARALWLAARHRVDIERIENLAGAAEGGDACGRQAACAAQYLDKRGSVTGWLVPTEDAPPTVQ